MIEIKNPADCCGCTACANICSHGAITMSPDALGFLYPVVDKKKCVNCGLCEKVCSFNDHYDCSSNLRDPEVYGARHKNMREIETSRSGAAFIAVSDRILERGGVVYGVGYTDHFRVVHKRAVTKKERNEFKGSKYVQSDLGDVFKQVKSDLKDGLTVLFSGTPCQIAGLKAYIGKQLCQNLFLVDIVCHGAPAPYIWRDYLAYLEEKQGNKINFVDFRDKQTFGWVAHKETFRFSNNMQYSVINMKESFSYLFSQNIMFRDSCGICYFCNTKRPSDITLADFWGWEKTDSDFNADNKGVSLVLVNTEKGHKLFKEAEIDLNVISASLKNCLQPNLQCPTIIHPKRSQFEKDYVKNGFSYIIKKYTKLGWKTQIKQWVAGLVKILN